MGAFLGGGGNVLYYDCEVGYLGHMFVQAYLTVHLRSVISLYFIAPQKYIHTLHIQ